MAAVRELLKRAVQRHGAQTALVSPHENIVWTYAELTARVAAVAHHLSSVESASGPGLGGQRCVLLLNNVADNLVAQLGCASAGVALHTVKTRADLAAACAVSSAIDATFAVSTTADFVGAGVEDAAEGISGGEIRLLQLKQPGDTPAGEDAAALAARLAEAALKPNAEAAQAYYNSPKGAAWAALASRGAEYAAHLGLGAGDGLFLAVPLNHAFGMGSTLGALGSGSWVALAGSHLAAKIGSSEAELAVATLARLEAKRVGAGGGLVVAGGDDAAFVSLVCDAHLMKGLRGLDSARHKAPRLRSGLVKVGSGEGLGEGTAQTWAGAQFTTVGK